MGYPLFLKHILLTVILFLYRNNVIAQIDPPSVFQDESDALYSLKATFNDPFLNSNWNGHPCLMNQPPLWYGIQCDLNGHVTGISLEDMGLTGEVNESAFFKLLKLSSLSFRNNSIWGNIMDFSFNQKLNQINLSGNMFYGPISLSLLSLNLLGLLQLQDNNLTGPIPEFNQPSLKVFNVSNNNLDGSISITQALQRFGISSYSGNPGLCGPPSPVACKSTRKNDTTFSHEDPDPSLVKKYFIFFLLFSVAALVGIILLFVLYCKKAQKLNKVMKEKETKEDVKRMEAEERIVLAEERRNLIFMEGTEAGFEISDLLRASAEGLGKGIFGTSYKALLNGGAAVVVKRLRDLKPLSSVEFTKQLLLIADHKHPNLLPLLAYHNSMDEKLLVYKYAENGNLFDRIHEGRGGDRIPFKWSARLSVARGVARALDYLHLNTKSQSIVVPHGNLKSSNVLLDENHTVLVSDYGLTSLIALPIAAQRMVSYKSPEYQNARKVSKQSDVWSYGCLLLELLTGKFSAKTAPPGVKGVELCGWVHRALREEWTGEIFDVEISMQRNAAPGMLRLLQIAMRCCENSPENRPEMTEVVREVENIKVPHDTEDEDDLSLDRSLTDDSLSTTASGIVGDERQYSL